MWTVRYFSDGAGLIRIQNGCDTMEHYVTYGSHYGTYGCITIRQSFLTDARIAAVRKYIRLCSRLGNEQCLRSLWQMIQATELPVKRRSKIEKYYQELIGGVTDGT